SLKLSQDQYDKQRHAYQIDPRAVSRDALDTASNSVQVAAGNLEVVNRQYQLTRAGAFLRSRRSRGRRARRPRDR
ncbi:efflux RND transporter periplasmic adaptor subunit, partial [Burkholderia gladioli]|nr:efflux RND transporter periplasmic adaptor subunit [Burkholderia gladioli]